MTLKYAWILALATALILTAPAASATFSITEKQGHLNVTTGNLELQISPHSLDLFMVTANSKSRVKGNWICLNLKDKNTNVKPRREGNNLVILKDTPMKKIIRAEYPLYAGKDRTGCSYIVTYALHHGIPGVEVLEQLKAAENDVSVSCFTTISDHHYTAYGIDALPSQAYGDMKNRYANTGSKQYVTARKNGHTYFYRNMPNFNPPKSFYAAYDKPISPMGIPLRKGERITKLMTIGSPTQQQDIQKLMALRETLGDLNTLSRNTPLQQPEIREKDHELFPFPLETPANGWLKNWEDIPIMAKRDETQFYRPVATNTWNGPQDLSFVMKAAYDDTHLYLKILVRDEVFNQESTDSHIWTGDALQIAVDPLGIKGATPDYIEFGVAGGQQTTAWCWQHPNRTLIGDIAQIIKTRIAYRKQQKVIDYELAVPWTFLKPFALDRGKLGFNLCAIDRDNGPQYENWMGLTDGLMGGKDPSAYKDLILSSFENFELKRQTQPDPNLSFEADTYYGDQDITFRASVAIQKDTMLPADLVVQLEHGKPIDFPLKKGFNLFTGKLPRETLTKGKTKVSVYMKRNGQKLFARQKYLAILDVPFVEKLTDQLELSSQQLQNKLLRITAKRGKSPDYLNAYKGMTDHFISFIRQDIKAEGWIGYNKIRWGFIKATEANKKYSLRRAYQNLCYLLTFMDSCNQQAEDILQRNQDFFNIPTMPPNTEAIIEDGGFKVAGRELMLNGPNTWSGLPYMKNNHFIHIANSGMNLVNIFYCGGEKRDFQRKLTETLGVYHSTGQAESLRKWAPYAMQHKQLDPELVKQYREQCKDKNKHLAPYESPYLVYVVGMPEQFSDQVKTQQWKRSFQRHLTEKFKDTDQFNARTGMKLSSFQEVTYDMCLKHPALKYEQFLFRLSYQIPLTKQFADLQRSLWKKPITTHYSTAYNIMGLDPLLVLADFEAIWKCFDCVGFDGGIGLESNAYAMNFSKGTLELDLARSIYPQKPICNNENHMVRDGVYADYSNELIYASTILPFFHGLNASSLWVWDFNYHAFGEYVFTIANTYHATVKAILDMRRLSEEIAAFRKAKEAPFRLLHVIPSMADRSYIKSLYDVYEGCYFTGNPVRFVTERMIADKGLEGVKVLVIPNAQRIADDTLENLADFAQNGGRVLLFGEKALTQNEYGKPQPNRKALLEKFTRYDSANPSTYAQLLNDVLEQERIAPEIRIIDSTSPKPLFGVEYRSVKTPQGKTLLYIINLNRKNVTVHIQSPTSRQDATNSKTWTDLITGKQKGTTITLKPLELLLLKPN